MFSRLLNSLSRITSRGDFIPEIDGLRFLAILQVLFLHGFTFIAVKAPSVLAGGAYEQRGYDHPILKTIFGNGGSGVYLFFAISGFILSLPFAQYYLNKGRKIGLKNYYLRRITRIEPPYIISMIILFIANVYVVGKYSFDFLFPRLAASLGYVHNFVYHGWSRVNGVAWSLEIEVQFYILAPFLATVFLVKNKIVRRFLLFFIALLIPVLNHYFPTSDLSLYNFLHYFIVGFILADLYATNDKVRMGKGALTLLGFVFLAGLFLIRPDESLLFQIMFTASIFGFYYIVFNTKLWSRLFSIKFITVIGGMCYTIYLYHYQIISFFGNKLIRFTFSDYFPVNFAIHLIMYLIIVVVISSFFFYFLERPFMRRNWPALFWGWLSAKARSIYRAVFLKPVKEEVKY